MLYRGEEFDSGLGFYYLRARWYDPASGRFLTADKYEGDDNKLCCQAARTQFIKSTGAGSVAVHHLRQFTNHEPVNFVDPSGHGFIDKAILSWVVLQLNPYYQAYQMFCNAVGASVVLYHTVRITGGTVGLDYWESGGVGCLPSRLLNNALWLIPPFTLPPGLPPMP